MLKNTRLAAVNRENSNQYPLLFVLKMPIKKRPNKLSDASI
jgi:hypothetical protein